MKLLYSTETEVRWGDMDAFGHVNNTVFLRYIEDARVQWFMSLSGAWNNPDIAPILAAVQMNFRRPITWPEKLKTEMFVERVGGKSLTIAHRISALDDSEKVYGDGNAVLVWVNREGKPVELPESMRAACS